MKKILHTGGTGFFSLTWTLDTKKKFNNFLLINKKRKNLLKNSLFLNFNSKKSLEKIIKKVNPDYIFHTIALTNVDECEKNFLLSKKVNFDLTKIICDACIKYNIKLVYISTDQIFNKKKKITENEIPNPLNTYGTHKLQSENYIISNLKNYLIVRANFFGYAPRIRKSFLNFVKYNLEKKKKIYLYNNINHSPISLHLLNNCIVKLLSKKYNGIVNVSSNENITKYNLGILISDIFNLDRSYIVKSFLKKKKGIALRPVSCFLSNKKLKKILKIKIPKIKSQLLEIFKKHKNNYYNKILKIN